MKYLKKLIEVHNKESKKYKSGHNVARVMHDDWCKSNTAHGRNVTLCNCNAEVVIINTDGSEEEVSIALGIKPDTKS